jgi:hypothetical protein
MDFEGSGHAIVVGNMVVLRLIRNSEWAKCWATEESGFDSRWGQEIFLLSITLSPIQSFIQLVLGAIFPRDKGALVLVNEKTFNS